MPPKKIGEYKYKVTKQKTIVENWKCLIYNCLLQTTHSPSLQNVLDAFDVESQALTRIHITISSQLERLKVCFSGIILCTFRTRVSGL